MNEEEDAIIDISEDVAQDAGTALGDGSMAEQLDFGALNEYLDDDDIIEVSYNNNGQLWIKSLKNGLYREDNETINDPFIESLAQGCSEISGKNFNMASPFLDVNIRDISISFIHSSVAQNGIAAVFSKNLFDLGKIEEEVENDKYLKKNLREFLLDCVKAHCNIIVCGDNDSGKEELLQYLVSNIPNSEKIVAIEAESQLNLDSVSKARDIVSLKANNIASYSRVLSVGLKQKPRWVVFSEILNGDTVMAVKNVTLSGHHVLSTMYADKAESIPYSLYGLLNENIGGDQFLNTIYRSIQLSVLVKSKFNSGDGKYEHEVVGICEFYVDKNNNIHSNNIFFKDTNGKEVCSEPSEYLKKYLISHGVKFDSLFNGETPSTEAESEEAEASKNTSSIKISSFNDLNENNSEVEGNEEASEEVEEETSESPEEVEETPAEVKPAVPINPLSGIGVPDEPQQQVPEIPMMPPSLVQQTTEQPPQLMKGANLMAGANIQQPQVPPNLMQVGPGPAQQAPMQGNAIIQTPDSAIVPDMPNLISGVDQAPPMNQKPGGIIPGFAGGANTQAPPLMGNPQMQQQPPLMQGANLMGAAPIAPDSPEAQLMGIGSLQPQKQDKPQLMGKPNPAKKKPFAKQKFYSGVGK